MRSPLLGGLLLMALMASRADAQSDGPGIQRVAVVRLDFQGGVPEAVRARFAQRVVEGLAAARFEVLAGDGLQRRLHQSGARPCSEPSCYPEFARTLGVGYLVSGKISEQDKTYDIKLDLINGRTGAILAGVHERCETCGLEDAAEKVNLASSALRTRLEAVTRSPARFVIRSRPQSALAQLDGKPMGNTPLDLELSSGEHQLSLRAPDHEPLIRTFVVVSGVDETLDLELVRTPTTFPYRPIGWTGLTVGALAIAGGIFALAVDGKEVACSKSMQDSMGHCPRVRSTGVLGAVLLGVGSASAAIGGISLYLGSESGPESAGRELGVALSGKF
jgi:predicted Zn-ribbon and HTH transcriptional regulator